MLLPDEYTTLARIIADVPAPALSAVRPRLADKLGSSVSEMFPEFANAFPLTVARMEAQWSKPALALKDTGRDWLATLFLEQSGLNLFLKNPFPIYAEAPDFDVVIMGMMPPRWIALYRSMESFVVTKESSYSPLGWINTPLPRGLRIDQFSSETNIKKAKLRAFAKQLDMSRSEYLNCWMLTEAHDSLWIDEQHCDRKVYHVHADAIADAYVLPDPGATLDRYLAHVVAGGLPKDFDFRGAD
jgi:hypothetical protein